MEIKKGDIVGRYSYNSDIVFFVDRIICIDKSNKIAILKGVNRRIEADAPIYDLQKLDSKKIDNFLRSLDNNFYKQINKSERNNKEYTGKILHLDGDKRYSEKTLRYYKKMGLNAIVKNIAESRQPQIVEPLIKKYQPDILIITGHDAMLKNGRNYFDICNYRNSRYFINTVINARRCESTHKKLAIFAGACQSFYEAIIEAGADFASSPGRILIDFIDPIIVAKKIATTDKNIYITGREVSQLVKEGEKGVYGIGTNGKKNSYNNFM